jgi:AraC-like DNA-binding protein
MRADLNTGSRIVRNARQARLQVVPTILLSTQEQGDAYVAQFGSSDLLRGGLICTDLTAPYEFTCPAGARGVALQIPVEELALPMDVIRRAQRRLAASPMSGLVRRHIADVARDADRLATDPGAVALGAASVELARALLASAAQDARARDVLAQTLLTRIRVYVRQHIADPELRAERIAAAHHISERYLYRLCSDAGFSLAHWIMSQRLSNACQALTSAEHADLSIAVIAHRAGFADPSHFSRRFREEFGMSPRVWRRAALSEPPAAPRSDRG